MISSSTPALLLHSTSSKPPLFSLVLVSPCIFIFLHISLIFPLSPRYPSGPVAEGRGLQRVSVPEPEITQNPVFEEENEEWPTAPPPRRSRDRSRSSAANNLGVSSNIWKGAVVRGEHVRGSRSGPRGLGAIAAPEAAQVEEEGENQAAFDLCGDWKDDFLPIEPVRSRRER